MKYILAILALLTVFTVSPVEARDRHRGDRHHHHDHDHGRSHRHRDYYRGHDHGHHYHSHYRSGCGYPTRGSSYRCNGGFMVWLPGLGYVFRRGYSSHYCD